MRVTQTAWCLVAGLLGFMDLSAWAAQVTRLPYLQSCTSTSVVVRWRTDELTTSRVTIHGTNGQQEVEFDSNDYVTDHEMLLNNLTPGTFYHYAVGTTERRTIEGPNYYFRTHPTNARPTRIWAIGDSGDGGLPQITVRNSYMGYSNSALTDVFLMLGDNVYGIANEDDYHERLFRVYSDIMAHTTLWPALGNHDAPWGTPDAYLSLFTLPQNGEAGGVPSRSELYYSFDYGNIHFVCLDSWLSDRSSNGPMCNWLRADLAATSQDWIIAYWHHPPYSMGTDFSDSTGILIEMREQVVPILESFGVDLVLSGHSHVYERSGLVNGHYGYSWTFNPTNALDFSLGRPGPGNPYTKPPGALGANRGTVYLVCGNSGQGGPVTIQRHPVMVQSYDQYGSLVLDVEGLKLNAKYLRPNGAIDDYFTFDKSPASSLAVPMKLQRSTTALTVAWPVTSTNAALEYTTNLLGTNWQRVTWPTFRFGRTNRITLPPTNSAGFFRVRSHP